MMGPVPDPRDPQICVKHVLSDASCSTEDQKLGPETETYPWGKEVVA